MDSDFNKKEFQEKSPKLDPQAKTEEKITSPENNNFQSNNNLKSNSSYNNPNESDFSDINSKPLQKPTHPDSNASETNTPAPSNSKQIFQKTNINIQDKRAHFSNEEIIEKRKEKLFKYFKKNPNWIIYLLLAGIIWLSIRIRTLNLHLLTDVTTNTWTLGPDLDPFLFLRWAKYIVANGSLYAIDTFRYSPLGYETNKELLLHPYMIAWFHNIASNLGTESVTHSAVIYPVFFFALTIISFFLLTRKIFQESLGTTKANFIALIASFFLTVLPILLARTTAGIPEKESAAFFFLFLSFYFFISAWKAKSLKIQIIVSLLAGLSTAGMALVWGGFGYIFLILSVSVIIAFLLGQTDKKKTIVYGIWLIASFSAMIPFSSRYEPILLLSSLNTAIGVFTLFVLIFHFYAFKYFSNYFSSKFRKIPPLIISFLISSGILVVLSSIVFGLDFIPSIFRGIIKTLITPAITRLIQTVAENRQPFFNEYVGNFGPVFNGVPFFFCLFFIGSIYLFYNMLLNFPTKDRIIFTSSFTFCLTALFFSRYASNSSFNGTNFQSLVFYFSGILIFIATIGYYYFSYHKKGTFERFKSIDFNYIFLFSFYLIAIISARAAIRLIMILGLPITILVAYLIITTTDKARIMKKSTMKLVFIAIAAIIIISAAISGFQFYKSISFQSENYGPSSYAKQWQKSMGWVREETPPNSVFGHWWDYGYWIQSIGERATVLDGGNAISYWNHLMGRYGLTSPSNQEALEFLYAHNTTHFLIDSSDIGKYSAFSLIGSNEDLDRRSFIPTFPRDNQATQELKNSTTFFYQGGFILDEDIILEQNGSKLFLPAGKAILGAIIIEKNNSGDLASQPKGIFVYQDQQITLPIRYAYEKEFIDYGSGIEAGYFPTSNLINVNGNLQIEEDGSLLYLSKRIVRSQLARLYLFQEDNPNFKLVHSQDDLIIENIKNQNPSFNSDFIQYQGLKGPIKIWEIKYPENITYKPEFIDTFYPEELAIAR